MRTRSVCLICTWVAGLIAVVSGAWGASVGTAFTYQGQLRDGGLPADGSYNLQFSLYDAATGGNKLGPILIGASWPVTKGLFSADLDFGVPFDANARWLEVAVAPGGSGTYITLSPRQRIAAVPYALYALGPWTTSSTSLSYSGGKVGIGTATPEENLSVSGTLKVDQANTNAGTSDIKFGAGATGEGIGSKRTSGGNQNGLDFFTNWISQLNIANDGTVGVTGKLYVNQGHVTDDTAPSLVFGNSSSAEGIGSTRLAGDNVNGLDFYTGGSKRMSVTNTGNVGIGTSSPGSKLTVAGTIESKSGGIKFPDGSVQSTAAAGSAVGGANPMQAALLRWYGANQVTTFTVGTHPAGVAFDGANIWVANQNSNTVTKLRANDGYVLGTYAAGTGPFGVAFDGANIWVTDYTGNTVKKLRASDGSVLGTYSVGSYPMGIAFDGTNIWVANSSDNNVTKLLASNGSVVGTYNVGIAPAGLAFDGTNIWVANYGGNSVTKLLASSGGVAGTYTVGTYPLAVAFDGANMWVVNAGNGSVKKLRASDGSVLGTYSVGTWPMGVAFDGANIWVVNSSSNNVTKLRDSDGSVLGTYSAGSSPEAVAFDGVNIWVANADSNTVSKL